MSVSKSSPSAKLAHMKSLRAGIVEKFSDQTKVLVVHGVEQPASFWLQKLDGFIAIWQASENAHRDVVTTVTAREAAEFESDEFLDDLRDAVVPFFGRTNQDLKTLDLRPRKGRKKPTAKSIVARSQKAAVTRGRNHTMGKRQKKALKDGAAGQPAPSGGGVSQGAEPTKSGAQPNPSPSNAQPGQ